MGRKRRPPAPVHDPRALLAATIAKWTVSLALWAWVLHVVSGALLRLVGLEPVEVWEGLGASLGVSGATVRLVLFGGAQLGTVIFASNLLASASPAGRALRSASDRIDGLASEGWRRVSKARDPRVRKAVGVAGGLVGGAVFVAFVLQPTLVGLRVHRQSWLERAANLVDGTATASIVDSVAGLVRWFTAEPVAPLATVGPEAFDATLASDAIPLMDRWDPWLLEAAEGDRELAARTKAFMWVESGGRQFALSATGCAGLMQFCASTAQRRPFGGIFGVGAVSACGCDDCSVPRAVQIALETDPAAEEVHADAFPCDLADARFDPERSIRAGVAFVRELGDGVGDQLALMYVGYNAGPRVAHSLYATLREDPEITVEDLRPHLANALRPHYGKRAEPRADGLLEVHLPKLLDAYERWRP